MIKKMIIIIFIGINLYANNKFEKYWLIDENNNPVNVYKTKNECILFKRKVDKNNTYRCLKETNE